MRLLAMKGSHENMLSLHAVGAHQSICAREDKMKRL